MYPKINIDFEYLLSTKRGINVLGEYLRTLFFDAKKGFGCYETFELNPWVSKLPDDIASTQVAETGDPKIDIEEDIYTCASYRGIVMRYRWDGDGELEFNIPYRDTMSKPFIILTVNVIMIGRVVLVMMNLTKIMKKAK